MTQFIFGQSTITKIQHFGNKGQIISEFSLEITPFDFTKRGGKDEAWTKSLS